MVAESNDIALWRNTHVTDVAIGMVKRLADWELEGLFATDTANNGELASIARKVPIANFLEHWSRRSSAQGCFGQGPFRHPVERVVPSKAKGHLAVRRQAQNIAGRETEGARLESFQPGAEDLEWLVVPGCSVNHTLPVRSKAGRLDESTPENQLVKVGLQRRFQSRARKKPQPQDQQCRNSGH